MEDNQLIKELRVVSVTPETPNAVSLILEPIGGWQPRYRSGQFITLVFDTPFGEKRRSYSLSGSSETGDPLQITVKKIDNGEFSRPLNYYTRPGSVLKTTGVYGMFTLPDPPGDLHYFFIAAGSGITPCYPMIKTLLHKSGCRVTLVYSNKSEQDAIFYRQLSELKKACPDRFSLRLLFSSSPQITTRRLSKWLLSLILDEELKDPRRALFYLCGPFEFMQMCTISLLTRVDRAQIKKEDFDQHPRLEMPRPPDTDKHMVKAYILGKEYDIPVQYPDPITKAAGKMNVALPYSCEAGRCGSCIATVVSGQLWMAYNEVLTDREVERGRVLTCQAFPVGGDAAVSFD